MGWWYYRVCKPMGSVCSWTERVCFTSSSSQTWWGWKEKNPWCSHNYQSNPWHWPMFCPSCGWPILWLPIKSWGTHESYFHYKLTRGWLLLDSIQHSYRRSAHYTNCIKYNGKNDDLLAIAWEMLTKFEEQILSDDECGFFHGYDLPLGVESHTTVDNQSNNSGGAIAIQHRSRHQIPMQRSSLEDLPVPRESFDSQSRQTWQRTQSYDARCSSRQARSTRVEKWSVLESSGLQMLEQLSSNSWQGLRWRTVQGRRRFSVWQQNTQQAAPEVPMPHHSSWPGLRNSVDAEIPSINEERQVHLSQARSVTQDERGSHRIHISTRHAEANIDDMVSHDEPELEHQASQQRQDMTTTLMQNSVACAALRPAHCNESSQMETNHSECFSGSISSSDDSGEDSHAVPYYMNVNKELSWAQQLSSYQSQWHPTISCTSVMISRWYELWI